MVFFFNTIHIRKWLVLEIWFLAGQRWRGPELESKAVSASAVFSRCGVGFRLQLGLETSSKCRLLDSTPDLVNQTLGVASSRLCFNKPARGFEFESCYTLYLNE